MSIKLTTVYENVKHKGKIACQKTKLAPWVFVKQIKITL